MCLVEDRMGCFLMKGRVKIIGKKLNYFSSCMLMCQRIKRVYFRVLLGRTQNYCFIT